MPDALYPKDLSDLGELSTAEKQVLEAVANGKMLELGTDVPEQPRDEVRVRAGLIRLLATGGCEGAEVHPLGVMITGAWITSSLALDSCALKGRFWLKRCKFEAEITASDANIASFSLSGSHIAGLDAPGIVVVNDLTLRDGFRCKGTVDLTHAEVGGQFDCSQGVFMNPDANALLAQWIKVGGSVFLKDGFSAEGEVSFLGARIDGQFSVVRAYLSDDHSHAFSGQNMRVGEIFYWRDVAVNDGTVLLTGARVGALADDSKSWPEDRVMMDGFVYDRLVYADTTLATRLDWLSNHMSNAFQPQPYQQLARVYGEMGHRLDQGRVLMEMERQLRINQRQRMDGRRYFHMFWDWVLRSFTGYGYRPWRVWRIAVPLVIVVAAFGSLLWEAGDFAPAQGPVLMSAGWQDLAADDAVGNPAKTWAGDAGPGRDYETFNPVLYALDLVVPLVNLGQEDAWAPSTSRGLLGKVAHWVLPVVEVLGWVITALGAAAVTGVIRRE